MVIPLPNAFGEISLLLVLAELPLRQEDIRKTMFQLVRATGFAGRIAVTSHAAAETDSLRPAGAHLVF